MPAAELTQSLTLRAPAKINLVLAITGVRDDGFHNLTSLVAPVDFGDVLVTTLHPQRGEDSLHCNAPGVPVDSSNLVLKAAAAFNAALAARGIGLQGHWQFDLQKRIPAGAGLGGGSSDASAALRAMNRLSAEPLSEDELMTLAAQIGSDCPLFLAGEPLVMRGRGEQLTALGEPARESLRGRRVLLFKPDFGINTGWAYGQMKAAQGRMYVSRAQIEAEIAVWEQSPAKVELPLFNNMQLPAFDKYLALPALLEQLREQCRGLRCLMSGSGSACFALLEADTDVAALKASIRSGWGEDAFCEETVLL